MHFLNQQIKSWIFSLNVLSSPIDSFRILRQLKQHFKKAIEVIVMAGSFFRKIGQLNLHFSKSVNGTYCLTPDIIQNSLVGSWTRGYIWFLVDIFTRLLPFRRNNLNRPFTVRKCIWHWPINQNFLDTNIIPETQYPLLKLLVFKVALHASAQQMSKEKFTRFYYKCLKPKRTIQWCDHVNNCCKNLNLLTNSQLVD